MNVIVIEKGIPIPSFVRGKKGIHLPFSDMNVGDSFALDFPEGVKRHLFQRRIYQRAYLASKDKKLFKVLTHENKLRVWRIK